MKKKNRPQIQMCGGEKASLWLYDKALVFCLSILSIVCMYKMYKTPPPPPDLNPVHASRSLMGKKN